MTFSPLDQVSNLTCPRASPSASNNLDLVSGRESPIYLTHQEITILLTVFLYNVSPFAKKGYLQDLGRPSTTFLAHLFGKIDSFLLFCSLRSPRKRGSSKTARKNQFCQTNVREKLLKNWTKVSIFNLQITLFATRLTIKKII